MRARWGAHPTNFVFHPRLLIYSRRSEATGLAAWDATDVTGPARHRLYHLAASAHFLLASNDERVEVVP